MKFRGIIHNHSSCSKEGCYPLSVLRQRWAPTLDFAAMTEHAERTTAEAYASYLEECERLSDERFRFIPGLEVATESGDMLLVGCRKFIRTRDPLQVLQEAGECIVLLAHPEEGKIQPDVLAQAHGIEGWNLGHMGGYMPPIDWLVAWRQKLLPPGKLVTGGNDIHKVDPKRKILTFVESPSMEEAHILESIRQGKFTTSNGVYSLTSDGQISHRNHKVLKYTGYALRSQCYRLIWRSTNICLQAGGATLATLGIDKQRRTALNRRIRQYL